MKRLRDRVVCGIVHQVFLATPEEEPALKDGDDLNAGCCRPWDGKIFVRVGASPAAIESTIDHEVVHCIIYHSGLCHVLRDIMKVKNYETVEEAIVQHIVLHKDSL